jgi:hypothetical protein
VSPSDPEGEGGVMLRLAILPLNRADDFSYPPSSLCLWGATLVATEMLCSITKGFATLQVSRSTGIVVLLVHVPVTAE